MKGSFKDGHKTTHRRINLPDYDLKRIMKNHRRDQRRQSKETRQENNRPRRDSRTRTHPKKPTFADIWPKQDNS